MEHLTSLDLETYAPKGVCLLGCGNMGGALLKGWIKAGASPHKFSVIDPNPAPWLLDLAEQGLHLNPENRADCDLVVLAVKPQVMAQVLESVGDLKADCYLSIAAGISLAGFEAMLGTHKAIIRTMPNTPVATGQGATALVANAQSSEFSKNLANALMQAVGVTVWLEDETQIDAVTALSGSGPAYVFHMMEALCGAGVALGLSNEMAERLARATVCGAGSLAVASPEESATQLRVNVTSPGGVTAAALEVLADSETGLTPLMIRTLHAAQARNKALG